jgi:hypothetical protein
MSSMNSRFKALGFGKRKSTASIPTSTDAAPRLSTATPPPQGTPPQPQGPPQIQQPQPQFAAASGPAPSIASSSSQQSLPTMNHPGAGPRPPSYTANYPQGQAPPVGQRMSPAQGPTRTPPSQMVGGPPPINTGAPVAGYPPQMMQPGAPPPGIQGGPPGYAGATGYPPPAPLQNPAAMQQFGRPAAEVEGNSRSKAQLIVGIDFVRTPQRRTLQVVTLLTTVIVPGNHLFRCRIRLCDQ